MLICKAERLDGKGEVEGCLQINRAISKYFIIILFKSAYIPIEINHETLKHSFDNGKSWWTEDEIKENLQPKSCGTCEHGSEEDGDVYDCYMSRDYFGYDHVALPKDFYCNKHEIKALEDK